MLTRFALSFLLVLGGVVSKCSQVVAQVDTTIATTLSFPNVFTTYGDTLIFTPNFTTTNSPAPITYTVLSGSSHVNIINNTTLVAVSAGTVQILASQDSFVNSGFLDTLFLPASNSMTLTILPATLVVKAKNISRIYGRSNPQLGKNDFLYSGFQLSDNKSILTVGQPSAFFPSVSEDSGVYSIIPNTSQFSTVGGNYVFQANLNGTMTILPDTLVVRAKDTCRLYGGSNPILGFSNFEITGYVFAEDSSDIIISQPSASMPSSMADQGTYNIFPNLAQFSDSNNNYVFVADTSGMLMINPDTLLVRAIDTSRLYGAGNPILELEDFLITGYNFPGDTTDISVFQPSATMPSITTSQGMYNIFPNLNQFSSASGNYVFLSDNNGLLTINPDTLIIRAIDSCRLYGDPNPIYNLADFLITGYNFPGDTSDISVSQPSVTLPVGTSNQGMYNIFPNLNQFSSASGNYVFLSDTSGMLTIKPDTLSISAIDTCRLYGDPNPILEIKDFSITGYKFPGDTSDISVSQPSATMPAITANHGMYNIHPILNQFSAANGNYVFLTDTSGILTIKPDTLTVKAIDTCRLYGDPNPILQKEDFSIIGYKFPGDTTDVSVSQPSATMPAPTTSQGMYNISPNLPQFSTASGNYVFFGDNNGILTINPDTLTVKGIDTDRLYGDPNPVFDLDDFLISGYKFPEDTADISVNQIPVILPLISANVGPYPIIPISSQFNSVDGNYVFESDSGGVFTILADTLIVQADSFCRIYGDPNPILELEDFIFEGFKLNDDSSVVTVSQPSANLPPTNTPVGDYPILPDANHFSAINYVFIPNSLGIITIKQDTLCSTADNLTKIYGDSASTPTYTITGWNFPEEDLAYQLNQLVIEGDSIRYEFEGAGDSLNVGQYEIQIVAAGTLQNYFITPKNGTLTVIPREVCIIPKESDTLVYGDPLSNVFPLPNGSAEFTFQNFALGQDSTLLDSQQIWQMVLEQVDTTCVGAYRVQLDTSLINDSLPGILNYTFVPKDTILEIIKRPASITVIDTAKAICQSNPEPIYLLNNFAFSDSPGGNLTPLIFTYGDASSDNGNPGGPCTSAGTYPIEIQADYKNYNLILGSATLTIHPETEILFQPPDTVRTCADSVVKIGVLGTGFMVQYQWQSRPIGSNDAWDSLFNIRPYSGVTEDTLVIDTNILAIRKQEYRCLVSSYFGSFDAIGSNSTPDTSYTVVVDSFPSPPRAEIVMKGPNILVCTYSDAFQYTWGYDLANGDMREFDAPNIPYFRSANGLDTANREYWVLTSFDPSDGRSCPTRTYLGQEETLPPIPPEEAPGMNIFPNPNSGTFTIDLPDNIQGEKITVHIRDGVARSIQKESFFQFNDIEISLQPSVPEGVYTIELSVDDVKRFVKNFILVN